MEPGRSLGGSQPSLASSPKGWASWTGPSSLRARGGSTGPQQISVVSLASPAKTPQEPFQPHLLLPSDSAGSPLPSSGTVVASSCGNALDDQLKQERVWWSEQMLFEVKRVELTAQQELQKASAELRQHIRRQLEMESSTRQLRDDSLEQAVARLREDLAELLRQEGEQGQSQQRQRRQQEQQRSFGGRARQEDLDISIHGVAMAVERNDARLQLELEGLRCRLADHQRQTREELSLVLETQQSLFKGERTNLHQMTGKLRDEVRMLSDKIASCAAQLEDRMEAAEEALRRRVQAPAEEQGPQPPLAEGAEEAQAAGALRQLAGFLEAECRARRREATDLRRRLGLAEASTTELSLRVCALSGALEAEREARRSDADRHQTTANELGDELASERALRDVEAGSLRAGLAELALELRCAIAGQREAASGSRLAHNEVALVGQLSEALRLVQMIAASSEVLGENIRAEGRARRAGEERLEARVAAVEQRLASPAPGKGSPAAEFERQPQQQQQGRRQQQRGEFQQQEQEHQGAGEQTPAVCGVEFNQVLQHQQLGRELQSQSLISEDLKGSLERLVDRVHAMLNQQEDSVGSVDTLRDGSCTPSARSLACRSHAVERQRSVSTNHSRQSQSANSAAKLFQSVAQEAAFAMSSAPTPSNSESGSRHPASVAGSVTSPPRVPHVETSRLDVSSQPPPPAVSSQTKLIQRAVEDLRHENDVLRSELGSPSTPLAKARDLSRPTERGQSGSVVVTVVPQGWRLPPTASGGAGSAVLAFSKSAGPHGRQPFLAARPGCPAQPQLQQPCPQWRSAAAASG